MKKKNQKYSLFSLFFNFFEKIGDFIVDIFPGLCHTIHVGCGKQKMFDQTDVKIRATCIKNTIPTNRPGEKEKRFFPKKMRKRTKEF